MDKSRINITMYDSNTAKEQVHHLWVESAMLMNEQGQPLLCVYCTGDTQVNRGVRTGIQGMHGYTGYSRGYTWDARATLKWALSAWVAPGPLVRLWLQLTDIYTTSSASHPILRLTLCHPHHPHQHSHKNLFTSFLTYKRVSSLNHRLLDMGKLEVER